MTNKIPKSIAKFIRKEKAQIRRKVIDVEEQKKLIKEMIKKINIKK